MGKSRPLRRFSDGHRTRRDRNDAVPVLSALLHVIRPNSGIDNRQARVHADLPNQNRRVGARDPNLDAFYAVGPLDSKITAETPPAYPRKRRPNRNFCRSMYRSDRTKNTRML